MNARMLIRRNLLLVGLGLLLLINLLVLLLVYLESDSSQSSIVDVFSAYLYSVGVLLTGGYSDIFPATLEGRLIGYIFVFLNRFFLLVTLAFFIHLGTSLVKNRVYKL